VTLSSAEEAALLDVVRQFGDAAITNISQDHRAPRDVIPTGSIALDAALGIGGFPRGCIVEIYGPESSGKTTVALHAIASAQAAGGLCAFIDAEHALDPEYARRIGVDVNNLYVAQPDTTEQALEICEMLARSGALSLIVIDSVASLVPRAELEGDIRDSHVGLQVHLLNETLGKVSDALRATNTTALFVNHLRKRIDAKFGSAETTVGGTALKSHAYVRLEIQSSGTVKEVGKVVGSQTSVTVVKNKVAAPLRAAEFDILYGTGISREGSLIDVGVIAQIVKKSGSWYTYDGTQLGQGKENARDFLQNNPDLADEIEDQLRKRLGFPSRTPTPARRSA
jgi:recombination protein RecA